MAQWGQGQSGYQYPLHTGYVPQQAQGFQQQPQQPPPQQGSFIGGIATQPTGFPGLQRPGGFQQPQQPQQTGFGVGGGGLVPQPTGYPNAPGLQQRPPPPPVPPIPSQFSSQFQQPSFLNTPPQNQGTRFASPGISTQPTGFPPGGLSVQPTGYPGGGGLVPQPTGYVDPRLQMMSSTFLPANQSTPYNAAGLPQLLAPQQQLGGLSLQQSFQQHNQEAKGTAAPRVPWALSKGEKKSYDQIFRAWDTSSSGFIDGSTAIQVFGQSGLSKDELAKVWSLADPDNRGKLNIAEFHVAMGLIYRKLNGNEIPDQLPPELVPPSHRDLDASVNFVKDLVKNDVRASSPSAGPSSYLKVRSFNDRSAPGAGSRQDATVYKHTEAEPAGGYYTPRSRHLDRDDVRGNRDRGDAASDLNDLKRQLENSASRLDAAAAESTSRTREDEELDREMDDLRFRVKGIRDELEYLERAPRSSRNDDDRRRLERQLLSILHERIPDVERRIQDREARREREKRERDRDRDRRNETFGRYSDRDRDPYERRSYSRNEDRYDDRYGRDRDRDYSSRDYDRDRDRGRIDRDRDSDNDRDRRHDPRTPPPAPPSSQPSSNISKPPPPPPAPTSSAGIGIKAKSMTAEERQAYINEQAAKRVAERMAALGVTPSRSPGPKVDTSVEDRLAAEKKEAEEKAREAEKAAEERERLRRERLEGEKALKEGRSSAPPPPAPASAPAKPAPPSVTSLKKPPAPPPPRGVLKNSPKPPVTAPRAFPVPHQPVAPPVIPSAPTVDPEEERLRQREEELKAQKEARLARLRELEAQEEEERKREEERIEARIRSRKEAEERRKREEEGRIREEEAARAREEEAARKRAAAASAPPVRAPVPEPTIPSPAPPPAPPAPPPPPASTPGSHNPFSKMLNAGSSSATPSPSSAMNGGTNPFFKSQTQPSAPTPPVAPPAPVKSAPPGSYNVASADSEDDWGVEKEDDDESSEDELSGRDSRSKLAQQLFGSILPPARPQSAAAASSGRVSSPATPAPVSAPGGSAPAPPPPPSAPPAPPAPSAPAPSFVPASVDGRGALLSAIQSGARLRKTVTNDRSSAPVSGRVVGDAGPPAHTHEQTISSGVGVSPASAPGPAIPIGEVTRSTNRQSVDWYGGLAADHGAVSREPSGLGGAPPREEDEDAHQDVPAISVYESESASAAEPDLFADIDKGVQLRVRTLYAYAGQRAEDLSFGENVILTANPSKSGGDWWHGSSVHDGKSGFFPRAYVQEIESTKAKALYPYEGASTDELPFAEGDVLTIIDRSESDWWKAEQGGVIFVVPAAYFEIVSGNDTTQHETSSVRDGVNTDRSRPTRSNMLLTQPVGVQEILFNHPRDPHVESRADSDDGSGSDTESESEYHSFTESEADSISGIEDGGESTRRRASEERAARALERQMVMEAAGLVLKHDEGRKPPPRPVRRKSTAQPPTTRKRHPPPIPVPHADSDHYGEHEDKRLPGIPPEVEVSGSTPSSAQTVREGDAFDRYEAFKLQSANNNRLSVASVDSASSLSQSNGQIASADSLSVSSLSSPTRPHSRSESYGGGIFSQLLGRSKTPTEETRPRLVISGPISGPSMSNDSEDSRRLSASTSQDSAGQTQGFGSSWSSLVEKSALDGLPERERKRQEAIFEFIATEAAYVRDLQLIVEVFYGSMLSMLDSSTISRIFANVEDLLLTNTTFLSSLEERQRDCRLYIDRIGDILEPNVKLMGMYQEYCVNQANAAKLLQSLRSSNSELAAHLQHLRDENPIVRNLDLSSYLLVPMQRITRYPLLIKQIVHYTQDDEDKAKTEHALHMAEAILGEINEKIRGQENRERLHELSQDLWIGNGRLDLTAPTRYLGERKLIKEGSLSKSKRGRKLHAILCNDIFILTDEQAKTLYRVPIQLSEIQVSEVSGRDDTSFRISVAYPRGGDSITLRAPSARECRTWTTNIEKSAEVCRETERREASRKSRTVKSWQPAPRTYSGATQTPWG